MREDIATFDARYIPKEIRESVEELLSKNKASFDPKVTRLLYYIKKLTRFFSVPAL